MEDDEVDVDFKGSESALLPRGDTEDEDDELSETRRDCTAKKQLIIVTVLCSLFMCGEIVGGVISGSLALMTDAAHLASDLLSFIISLISLQLKHRSANQRYNFGYYRAETIGALLSIVTIWVVCVMLVYIAIERIVNRHFEILADEMILVAALGVAFNVIMGLVLHTNLVCKCHIEHGHSHGGGHGHSHGHAESGTGGDDDSPGAPPATNLNIRAALIHVLGDLLQSLGVLGAAYLIKYKPDWKIVDPICTLIFSVIVVMTTSLVLRDIFYILMEAAPKGWDVQQAKEKLQTQPGVDEVVSLRVWQLSLEHCAADVNLRLRAGADVNQVKDSVRWRLRRKGVKTLTIEHSLSPEL